MGSEESNQTNKKIVQCKKNQVLDVLLLGNIGPLSVTLFAYLDYSFIQNGQNGIFWAISFERLR